MLVPLVARLQGQLRRDGDPYSEWVLALERLREDWSRGLRLEPRQLGRYLCGIPLSQRRDAVQDLIAEHLQLSWRAGRGQLLEAYASMLAAVSPNLAKTVSLPTDLIEDEFLARHAVPQGDTPGEAEYERRFATRPDVVRRLRQRHLAGGRFVRLAKRGQGASGEVWASFDRERKEMVAIKLPRVDAHDHQTILLHFARESQLTAKLNHAGIVHLRECHVGGTDPLYVMRLVAGASLNDEISLYHHPPATSTSEERKLLFERLLDCLASACDVVAYAHANGLVNCDLKPGNIILESSGESAIVDWGMVRGNSVASTSDPVAAPVAGTPDYMAPEQLLGKADSRTDVFGLGATLYEILTGRPPHSWPGGIRPPNWGQLVDAARISRPRRWNPAVSRALEGTCLKALARDPELRHQSVVEFAGQLRRHIGRNAIQNSTRWLGRFLRR